MAPSICDKTCNHSGKPGTYGWAMAQLLAHRHVTFGGLPAYSFLVIRTVGFPGVMGVALVDLVASTCNIWVPSREALISTNWKTISF